MLQSQAGQLTPPLEWTIQFKQFVDREYMNESNSFIQYSSIVSYYIENNCQNMEQMMGFLLLFFKQ